MATLTGNFAQLLEPGLLPILGRAFRRRGEEYSKILNMKTSRKNKETVLKVAGLGLAQLKNQNDTITFDDPLEGPTLAITFLTYALGVSISWEMFSDDLYGYMRQVANELGLSIRETIEVLAMAPFNNAFDSNVTILNGKELCNTAHTMIDTSVATQSNKVTSSLSHAAIRDALIKFEKYHDDRGKQYDSIANRLLIGPDNRFLAREIFGAGKKPFTSDNEMNVLAGELQPMVSHYLTDPLDWFILGDKHFVDFFWRVRPVFRSFDDQATFAAKFTTAMRLGVKAFDWLGVFGSTGGN